MSFNFADVEDFDLHIEASIPGYAHMVKILKELARYYYKPGTDIIDYGCTTGALLNSIKDTNGANLVGYDISDAQFNTEGQATLIKRDITKPELADTGRACVSISLFTLQFLSDREAALKSIFQAAKRGSILFVAEKIYLSDSRLNERLSSIHKQYKQNHFSPDEIMIKEAQLRGNMHCVTDHELMQELNELGSVYQLWQSGQFGLWAVEIKK